MKLDIKKVDAVTREMKFEIPKDRVSQKLEEIYKELEKVSKIKGYRPGKAPRAVVIEQHGNLAREEVLKQIIPEAYQEALEKEKLHPIDMPDIENVVYKDGIISFTAKVEIKPEVAIKDYKDLKIDSKPAHATDEEIDKTIDYFKKAQGAEKEIVIDDNFAKGLGYPSLEKFRKSLALQIELDKDRQNRIDAENQIVEQLIKKAKLTVPQSLLKKQFERRTQEIENRMKNQGVAQGEIKRRLDGMKEELTKTVEKDVKAFLIMDKIAEEEKIEVAEKESLPAKVMEFLLKEAKWEEGK
ncbi:MAG: hypothetical protein HQL27_06555 [Candidatus Omnitrophica bacterium]|nr:hypothetical protein [Candidatus Omnitrophota bacterium]